jgi:hypothetical protein
VAREQLIVVLARLLVGSHRRSPSCEAPRSLSGRWSPSVAEGTHRHIPHIHVAEERRSRSSTIILRTLSLPSRTSLSPAFIAFRSKAEILFLDQL